MPIPYRYCSPAIGIHQNTRAPISMMAQTDACKIGIDALAAPACAIAADSPSLGLGANGRYRRRSWCSFF